VCFPLVSNETYANRAAAYQPPAVTAPAKASPIREAILSAKLGFIQGSIFSPGKKPQDGFPCPARPRK